MCLNHVGVVGGLSAVSNVLEASRSIESETCGPLECERMLDPFIYH